MAMLSAWRKLHDPLVGKSTLNRLEPPPHRNCPVFRENHSVSPHF
jgi:hypothetical protein